MAVKRKRFSILLRSLLNTRLHLFALTAAGWAGVLWLGSDLQSVESIAAFALTISLLFFVAHELLGIHSTLPVRSRLGDWFRFLTFNLLSAPAAYFIFDVYELFALCGSQACEVKMLWLAAPSVSAVIFLGDWVIRELAYFSGLRRTLVLDVTEQERIALFEVLRQTLNLDEIRFLSRRQLATKVRQKRLSTVDMVVSSSEKSKDYDKDSSLIQAHLEGVPVVDVKALMTALSGRVHVPEIDQWEFLQEALPQNLGRRIYRWVKWLFEPAAAFVLLVLFSPLIGLISIGVLLTSGPGGIFFRQRRVGYHGKDFVLIKFRTMRHDAEHSGPRWASEDDSRVTPFGSFLRRTRLDELPQLWNIMRGEMSFVGPRPERQEMIEQIEETVPLFRLRLLVRPGVTGWAQIMNGYAASVEQSKKKLEYDLFYIQRMSFWLDLRICLGTLFASLFGDKREHISRWNIPLLGRKREDEAALADPEQQYFSGLRRYGRRARRAG